MANIAKNVDKLADNTIQPVNKVMTSIGKTTIAIAESLKTRLPSIIITSLTLIAGLAWGNSFNALIDYYVDSKYRQSTNIKVKFAYAFILTIVIIIVISIIVQYFPK